MDNSIFNTIDNTSIFRDLDKAEKLRLTEIVEEKKYNENQTVFSIQDKGKYFYVVKEGALTLRLKNGQIRKYGPLSSFGEVAIFGNNYRTGVITADTATVLLSFHKSILFEGGILPPETALKISHQLVNKIVDYVHSHIAIPSAEIISRGENERVEFKASIDAFTSEGIMRTLVGFLNSQGGTIFIGVDDRKQIVGINSYDYNDIDRFCTNFTAYIQKRIGPCFVQLITYDIEEIDGKRIFRIDCTPATKPALLRIQGATAHNAKDVFIIRAGAGNRVIKNKRHMLTYIAEHFYAA